MAKHPESAQMTLRLLERLDAQQKEMQEMARALETMSTYVVDCINNLQSAAQAINRLELHTFALVKVGLNNGLEYKALHEAMEQLKASEDLFVFWGLRTQEEAGALKAQAQAAQDAALAKLEKGTSEV
jgi:hypothetical protein